MSRASCCLSDSGTEILDGVTHVALGVTVKAKEGLTEVTGVTEPGGDKGERDRSLVWLRRRAGVNLREPGNRNIHLISNGIQFNNNKLLVI